MVPGMCGVVEDGILPGYFGYEAGQSAVGDIFAWFVETCVPPRLLGRSAPAQGLDIHALLEEKAATLAPGQSGLLALDWWNGNRSVLVDVDLSGMLIGLTLATRARGDLPRLDRGHRLWHPHHHSQLRRARRARRRAVRLRRAARTQPAADADLRRRDRQAAARLGLEPDPGAGLGHVRRRGRGRGGRRLRRSSSRPPRRWPAWRTTRTSPIPRPTPCTSACTPSTCGCTTTSAAAQNDVMKALKAAFGHEDRASR